jgi:hypothetical protein
VAAYRSPAPGTQNLGPTWLEPEHLTYPRGGFTRRACVRLRRNPHNPIELPYGELRIVRASVADSFSSIPARLTYRGKAIRGFVSIDNNEFTFTPEAA